jgi:Tfp pilus assembly protein PilX
MQHSRRGAVAVIVMLVLLLAALLGTSLVKLALAQHRQTVQAEARLQATSLAHSGLSRAQAQLSKDGAYTGETWSVDGETLRSDDSGRVDISVEQGAQATARVVTIVAEFPTDSTRRVRVRRQIRFIVPDSPEQDTNTR